jgi:hypothetical protein
LNWQALQSFQEKQLAYTPAQFDLELKLALDVYIEPTYQVGRMLAELCTVGNALFLTHLHLSK